MSAGVRRTVALPHFLPGSRTRAPLRYLPLLAESALFLLALGLGWVLDAPALATLRLEWTDLGLGAAATVPMLVLLVWLVQTPLPHMRRLVRLVEERLGPLFAQTPGWELALLALVAGLGEEALFRGVLQVSLEGWLPVWGALLAAAVLFGVVHWVTPTYALLAGLVGMYLGGLFLLTDNLLTPATAHALYDFVALKVLQRRAVSGEC